MTNKEDAFWNGEISRSTVAWKSKAFNIIYKSDTYWGKFFDVGLLIVILLSILVVMLDSIPTVREGYGNYLTILEWVFTGLFTIEYLLRIIIIKKPKKYIFSFLGVIDLLSILPTFISLFFAGSQYLMVIRSLRFLRIFRIFKMVHFLSEIQTLGAALILSLRKISVFILFVVLLVIIMGSVMYLVEGGENGFDSIPSSIYWAVITLTTVGYGDIVPITLFGKMIASLMMLLGYGIIAVPTGIVTVELAKSSRRAKEDLSQVCPHCGYEGHKIGANYCFHCGYDFDKVKKTKKAEQ